MESNPVTAKDSKEARKMRQDSKVARKMRRNKRQSAEVVTNPTGKKDPLELAAAVESSEDITPLHSASAAGGDHDMDRTPVTARGSKEARKMRRKKTQKRSSRQDQQEVNQASASRRSPLPPSQEEEDESSSFASSRSSTKPGAVRVGDTKSDDNETALPTQEERDMEQGFETRIMSIASEVVLDEAVLPDHESKNIEAISEAQIVLETAKCCGQPRWLVFTFPGVLVFGVMMGGFFMW
jgi:hypothetical protein